MLVPYIIDAQLLTNMGMPVASVIISFSYKLTTSQIYLSAGTGVTDSDGNATSLTIEVDSGGTYDIKGVWAGNTVYASTMTATTFSATQTQDSTSILSSVAAMGTTIDIIGTLADSSTGAAIGGAFLEVSLDGLNVGAAGPTSPTGSFSFSIPNASLGTHQVGLMFAQTTTLLGSMTRQSVMVSAPSAGGLSTRSILGGIVAISTVVGVGAVAMVSRNNTPRRRRRR